MDGVGVGRRGPRPGGRHRRHVESVWSGRWSRTVTPLRPPTSPPTSSRRWPTQPAPNHRPRRLGKDPGPDRAAPPSVGRPALERGRGDRPRLQPEGGRGDELPARRRPLRSRAHAPRLRLRDPRPGDGAAAAPPRGAGGAPAIGPAGEPATPRQRGRPRPWLEALAEVRVALRPPRRSRRATSVPGFAAVFDEYRRALRASAPSTTTSRSTAPSRHCYAAPTCGPGRRRCRHLLVDEFQDLTPAHLLFARLLAAPGYDVFGVATTTR